MSKVIKSILLGVVIDLCVGPVSSDSKNINESSIFVFGDSVFDPGNQNYRNVSIFDKANYWPYGETFFNFSTGRFCDGRTIPDFLATKANLPLWKPYLGNENQSFSEGANFAAASAGVLPQTNPGSLNLRIQFSFYREVASQLIDELGEEEAKNRLMESIYLSSIGGDDYVYFYNNNPNATHSEATQFVQLVIGNLTKVIKEIYEIGGRKFAFQNVGPMGCLPVIKVEYGLSGVECMEQLLEIATLHNKLLLETAEELETQLQGFKYMIFDYYSSLYDIIQNPSNYGLEVSDVPCCDGVIHCGIEPYETCNNVTEYVFFDAAHPTEATNLILSNLMWNGDSSFATPFNFQQLLNSSNPIENNATSSMVGFASADL